METSSCVIDVKPRSAMAKMSKRKNGNSEDFEMEQMSRAELVRLQRQYRIMEGDREAYSQEVKILLQKQRKTVEILEREKADLLSDLKCINSRVNESKTAKKAARLKALLVLHEKLTNDIAREKCQIKELENQGNRVERELRRKKEMAKAAAATTTKAEDGKSLEEERARQQLENRLDVATVKLNRMLVKNRNLRENIDHCLKERSTFNQASRELTATYNAGKKIILDLMEQSTLAYDQREEAQTKLEALKQKGKQDVLIHSQEMKELQRKLDHDSKLQEFLGVKGQKRVMADLEAKEALRKQQQKELLEEQIRDHQSLLEEIRVICEETDIDRLAAQYLKQEEENFALFNYVNELNNELEALQEQVDEIEKNLEEQRAASEAKALEKKAVMETLRAELTRTAAERKETEEKLKECQRASDRMLEGIRTLYDLLKCDDSAVIRLLGENVALTTFNASLFLGVIEKKAAVLKSLLEGWRKMNMFSRVVGMTERDGRREEKNEEKAGEGKEELNGESDVENVLDE